MQAQDRAHRLGQRREVRCFRLITLSPIEEEVLNRAQTKLKIDAMVIQGGKFDKKTTSEERKGLLQDIIRKDIRTGEGNGAVTDEELNRMLCRSDEEFALFQKMDEEITADDARVWKELYGNKPCPGRFITEDELPAHVKMIDVSKLLAEDEEPSGSRTAKKETSYAEALTDRQFTRCIERG